MAQSIEEIKSFLGPWRLVKLTTKGRHGFKDETGYAGAVFDDSFEFKEVLNKTEHFSNISDPPELKGHIIKYTDVILIRKD